MLVQGPFLRSRWLNTPWTWAGQTRVKARRRWLPPWVQMDAIVKQGRNKDKHIATTHNAMVPKLDKLKDEVSRPRHCASLKGPSLAWYDKA